MITIIIPYVLHYATHFEQSQLLYQKTNEVVLPSNHSFIKEAGQKVSKIEESTIKF